MRFYIDTCVWRDLFEDRVGKDGISLGQSATDALLCILHHKHPILVSDLVIRELHSAYDAQSLATVFEPLERAGSIRRITASTSSDDGRLALERKIPENDVVHARTAAAFGAILITQDKHFRKLGDIVESVRPDEITKRLL